MSGFYMDFSAFKKEFEQVVNNTVPDLTKKGLFSAASSLKLDSDHVQPKTPVKEGHLKGSWMTQVGSDAGSWCLLCGFNVEYASYVHEMVKRHPWTEPESGPKFLESKLYMFPDKYLRLVAETIQQGAK
jgi:hypothetical protein